MIDFARQQMVRPLNVLKDSRSASSRADGVVVCGPSGSGKSTLIPLITAGGHQGRRPSSSTASAFAIPPPNMTQLRTEIGFVFQSFNLYPHKTALENVTLAPIHVRKSPARSRQAGRELLAKVGLADKVNAYPSQLSGGQQQRVAIARCLGMRPRSCCSTSRFGARPEMDFGSARRHGRGSPKKHDHDGGDARNGLCPQGRAARGVHDAGAIVESRTPEAFFSDPRPTAPRLSEQILRLGRDLEQLLPPVDCATCRGYPSLYWPFVLSRCDRCLDQHLTGGGLEPVLAFPPSGARKRSGVDLIPQFA